MNKVNKRCTYNYLIGLFIETWEDLLVTFSEKEMDGVYAPHYNIVVITTHMYGYRVQLLMADEGSDHTILFANC